MGESLSAGLRIVLGIVLTGLLITFVFGVWNSVRGAGDTALTSSNSVIAQMDEAKYMMYDGVEITGAEVINVISQHQYDNIYIYVDNGVNPVMYNYSDESLTDPGTGASIKDAKDKTNQNYILPNARFLGEVKRNTDGTGAIIGLSFTRVSADTPGSDPSDPGETPEDDPGFEVE